MINYNHRSLKDGEVYFFFNESRQTLSRTATLLGTGQVQVWDAGDGTIHPLSGVDRANGSVNVPVTLGPQGAMFIVIGSLPAGASQPWPTMNGGNAAVTLDGDWSVTLGGPPTVTPLKSWQDLGAGSFAGIAQYSKTFTAPATLAPGQRLYLDLGDANEVAQINLNGKDFDALGWPPFLWDVTDAVKAGDNALVVQVQIPPAGGRGGFGGFGGAAGRGAAGGQRGGVATAPAGQGRAGRGARGGGAGGGFGNAAPAPTTAGGLLGPVRLIAQ
jgi:hypothetical protein